MELTRKIIFQISFILITFSCSLKTGNSKPNPVQTGITPIIRPTVIISATPNTVQTEVNIITAKAPEPEDLSYQSFCINTGEIDLDKDGISDNCEDKLAGIYAPIIYHSSDESNFPTNVDKFLEKTSLWFYDDSCNPDIKRKLTNKPDQEQLISFSINEGCNSKETVYSNGTLSKGKHRTFFLEDVDENSRKGSMDSKDWITYVHSYQNDLGGITIQYWRFYPFNDAFNNHGGDWEGIHVILDKNFQPVKAALLGHTGIETVNWNELELEGENKTHPRIYSEGGGHASHKSGDSIMAKGCGPLIICRINPDNPQTFVRQETWNNGKVTWFNRGYGANGGLLNLGEKTAPMNNQYFIRYSGLWGSPGLFYFSSGYWGPAYNETGMAQDGFITAWGAGMKNAKREEVYPDSFSD
jgi:hypothetical protein